ncbi:EAL domain-containing protein [Thiohalophilus sp.]|uniref:EAL domain-containing protein n=1 Tax=Thiohalophilus sp. TaxID=3028392 RepID=UPI002ACE3674|nr:EAL domain-containing protein [Thiohalophilus sp.]MDZ7803980.1 EAL domain-containing protein [Thiohalophilus sp.]
MSNTLDTPIRDMLTISGEPENYTSKEFISRLLTIIRRHLKMDVAFISELVDGRRYFRHVDAKQGEDRVKVGGSDPEEDSYCLQVIEGRLPELIQDANDLEEARKLAATKDFPIGAHLSVPIRLENGRIYGTFCCFSTHPDHSLNERDLAMMHAFSEVAAEQIEQDLEEREKHNEIKHRISRVIDNELLNPVFQPIYDITTNTPTGFESLTRFKAEPARTPDVWFNEAAQVGLGVDLEIMALRRVLAEAERISSGYYVSVNLSPKTLLDGHIEELLCTQPDGRLVLELTEHAVVDCYEDLVDALLPLRNYGVRLAVDDAGAGFASFRHILALKPDIIKLDISITRNIDRDANRCELARGLMGFAHAVGSKIVAEGVETEAELDALRKIGIDMAQGYLLGKPMSVSELITNNYL